MLELELELACIFEQLEGSVGQVSVDAEGRTRNIGRQRNTNLKISFLWKKLGNTSLITKIIYHLGGEFRRQLSPG